MWYYNDEGNDMGSDVLSSYDVEEYNFAPNNHQPFVAKALRELVADRTKAVCLFGAVPPPKKCAQDVVESCCQSVAALQAKLNVHGIIIYDIQDEKSRNGEERPFPFFQTHDPLVFARRVNELCGAEMICYQALEGVTANTFGSHLVSVKARFPGVRNVVFVGGSQYDMTVSEATRLVQVADPAIFLGGITIPERHRDKGNEHLRVAEKSESGVSFFTSQVIYNADSAIWMMKDYDELCRQKGVQPARIIWAFAPFGRQGTLKFLRWLGVEVPEGTASRILSRPNTKECVQWSNDVCLENLKRILEAARTFNIRIPMGIAVESVSKFKDEQEGAEQLFQTLRLVIEEHHRWLALASTLTPAPATTSPAASAGHVAHVVPLK